MNEFIGKLGNWMVFWALAAIAVKCLSNGVKELRKQNDA